CRGRPGRCCYWGVPCLLSQRRKGRKARKDYGSDWRSAARLLEFSGASPPPCNPWRASRTLRLCDKNVHCIHRRNAEAFPAIEGVVSISTNLGVLGALGVRKA